MARVREAGMEDKILDSAFKVFGERGFAATTIKEIARGAGISSGSVYTYFTDKEALFKSAVNRGWAAFVDELETINRSEPLRDKRIALLLDRGFTTLAAALPLIRGMFFEASKLNLVAPNVDRVCMSISELLKPDEDGPPLEAWVKTASQRLVSGRIIVLGVLCSGAFIGASSPSLAIDSLKGAIRTLLSATGMLMSAGENR